ncbi:hypothetical protein PF006_g28211 [Phytophthora fragariae]|uniref:Uncharacterized protein n=1 Tax=Phytophthora fragariae TaxID=53985 RepID=A0A6A3QH24_9STRA|nr:hypothetical protein PF009_g32111 [Phytophthora fragariae]KAE9076045.1 hypothetical protein PF006_g28211 [Phytophthora fragariae]
MKVATQSFHVRWKRSTSPIICGRYGTGFVCLACSKFTNCSITRPVISGAPSVSSSLNTPNFSTTSSIKNAATLSAVCFTTLRATAYLVTYSSAAIT